MSQTVEQIASGWLITNTEPGYVAKEYYGVDWTRQHIEIFRTETAGGVTRDEHLAYGASGDGWDFSHILWGTVETSQPGKTVRDVWAPDGGLHWTYVTETLNGGQSTLTYQYHGGDPSTVERYRVETVTDGGDGSWVGTYDRNWVPTEAYDENDNLIPAAVHTYTSPDGLYTLTERWDAADASGKLGNYVRVERSESAQHPDDFYLKETHWAYASPYVESHRTVEDTPGRFESFHEVYNHSATLTSAEHLTRTVQGDTTVELVERFGANWTPTSATKVTITEGEETVVVTENFTGSWAFTGATKVTTGIDGEPYVTTVEVFDASWREISWTAYTDDGGSYPPSSAMILAEESFQAPSDAAAAPLADDLAVLDAPPPLSLASDLPDPGGWIA